MAITYPLDQWVDQPPGGHGTAQAAVNFNKWTDACNDLNERVVDLEEGGLVVHDLVGSYHSAAGLTPGHFLKALTATTFGFAAHGLSYSDVGAAASGHDHASISGSSASCTGNAVTASMAADSSKLNGQAASYYQTAFGNQNANTVYAGPTSGNPATPTFRALVAADLPQPWVWVDAFGAVGDDSTDDTAAFQAASDSLTSGGTVMLSAKTYKITSEWLIKLGKVNIRGQGKQSSIIHFVPSGAAICINFYKSGSVLYQCSISGIGFQSSSATNFTKVAISHRNTSELKIHDIAVYPWNGNSASVGIQTKGKELLSVRDVSIRADIPISIEDNPDSTIDIDHSRFTNCYLIADVGSCVNVASGVNLSNVIFDGDQAWVPKTYGFYWNDTETSQIAQNLRFENIRVEQETSATSYLFYISHNYNIYNLTFRNIYGGQTAKGFYLRKAVGVTVSNSVYVNASNNEALNVDSTVVRLILENNFWQTGTTASMTGQTLLWGSKQTTGPLPSSAVYATATAADDITASNLTVTNSVVLNSTSGTMGVGITSPDHIGQVAVTNDTVGKYYPLNLILIDTTASGSERGTGISFSEKRGGVSHMLAAVTGIRLNSAASWYGELAFSVQETNSNSSLESSLTEVARFNRSGYLGIGITSPAVKLDISNNTTAMLPTPKSGTTMRITAADAAQTIMSLDTYNSANGSTILCRGAGGTAASPSAMLAGIIIGQCQFIGYGATAFLTSSGAKFGAIAAGDWSDSTGPAALFFSTRASGTGSSIERFRISEAGNIGIGTSAFDATGTTVFTIANGTAPAAHVDNQIQIYSVDSSDATATLGLMLEQEVESIGTFTASHKIKICLNGTFYRMQLQVV